MLKKSPFYMVLRRELDRMVSRRLYFGVCIVLPLFCIFFMSTIFGSGQMENIPIAVVDQDNTSMSREIIRQVEAGTDFPGNPALYGPRDRSPCYPSKRNLRLSSDPQSV